MADRAALRTGRMLRCRRPMRHHVALSAERRSEKALATLDCYALADLVLKPDDFGIKPGANLADLGPDRYQQEISPIVRPFQ